MSRNTDRFACFAHLVAILALATTVLAVGRSSAQEVEVPGLGDPGSLTEIAFEKTGAATIAGPEYRLQLLVTGNYSSGQVRDLTHQVTYQAEPRGIVEIDRTGLVKPLADGKVTVTAKVDQGKSATVKLAVTGIVRETPISFANEVVPVFTKYGCNSGNCHGKSGGQNLFAMSLLGFYAKDDYSALTGQTLGRRISIAQPDQSLLLLKATSAIPHGGGNRLVDDSPDYRIIRRWIAQGAAYGDEGVRKVAGLEVFPAPRRLPRGGTQQVAVIASYTDGTREDVTRLARYESNNGDICDASHTGLMTTFQTTGNLAVMIRYQGQAGVFAGTVPMGLPVTLDNLPAAKNLVDKLAYKKFKELGLPPSELCDDATYLRRVTVDIAGRIPTLEETRAFLADKNPGKRDKLVDRLLAGTDYADYFAKKWSAMLKIRPGVSEKGSVIRLHLFHNWIRDSFHANRPYDAFVRDIIAASGSMSEHPPVVWYEKAQIFSNNRTVNSGGSVAAWMEDASQMFLGTRLACAKCHHHPWEKWGQDDYYSFLAFWSRMQRKRPIADPVPRTGHPSYFPPLVIGDGKGVTGSKHPRTGQTLRAAVLGQPPVDLPPGQDPRNTLVDWMAAADNPYFAHALVNRYWKHFFRRGLVEPEDDMRATNPPTNPELLRGLARHFIESRFNLKALIRTITTSNLYQLSSEPNKYNKQDKQNYSHFYTRRLNAEVLLDSVDMLCETRSKFSSGGTWSATLSPRTRAVQLPHGGFRHGFLTTFGMPTGESVCECERITEATLTQSLHLINSKLVRDKVHSEAGRAARLATDDERSVEAKLNELYLVAYARPPVAEELEAVKSYIESKQDKTKAYQNVVWALLNSKELLFQH